MFQEKLAEFHDSVYDAIALLMGVRPSNVSDGEVFDCVALEFGRAFRQAYEDVLLARGAVVA